MIDIFGPTYRYNYEVLTEPEIILINDHHYDDEKHCFHVKSLLDNSSCDPMQHLVVFDHIAHDDQLKHYNHISLPIFLAAESVDFAQAKIKTAWHHKPATFNFMINKPRPNREFLLSLIEHFGLTNFTYSLCWKNLKIERGNLVANTPSPLYKKIIQDTTINIVENCYTLGQEIFLDRGLRYGHVKNVENYTELLQKSVFEPSCISLITEPSFYERETLKTEKTIMAMYGGTLPIWIGGWGIPNSLRQLGFDVFDDIIDHSYEFLDDPWDRTYFAIEKNLKILQNHTQAQKFIKENHRRLQHNVDLIEQNVFLDHCKKKISCYDLPTQKTLIKILQEYNSHAEVRHPSLSGVDLSSVKVTKKFF